MIIGRKSNRRRKPRANRRRLPHIQPRGAAPPRLRPRTVSACFAALVSILWIGAGCSSVYYDAQERILGKQKRHILRDRVEAGQKDQNEAQEQFKTTLELFKEVTKFEGGELEGFYKKLQGEYDESEARAQDVRDRIDSIEKVARDLFAEWESEIALMQNPDLKQRSRRSLQSTETRYERYIAAMSRAEERMDPVLTAFRDQVLFLKHNLNAQAIASLKRDTAAIEADVDSLIGDMQRAIGEAESFLTAME